jgi:UDPglucose 6-dehydrogenase
VGAAIGDLAVVGLWHLGSVASAGWSSLGHRVTAWDPDAALRRLLRSGQIPVGEPGVREQLRQGMAAGRIKVVETAREAIAASPTIHLTYDVATDGAGHAADPRLDQALRDVMADAPPGALLLVSSQLVAGTCVRWQRALAAAGRGLRLAYVPENLRLGSALADFLRPARLLVGADDERAWDLARVVLAGLDGPVLRMGLTSAELAKHATNAYLAMCVCFANELAWLARDLGADPSAILAALRADPRVAPTAPLQPGGAFSGATLQRDVAALARIGQGCGRPELFETLIEVNERHGRFALDRLEEAIGSLEGTVVAVLGLTYKPGTSTLRDSLPLRIVRELLARGAAVRAYDPAAEEIPAPTPGLDRCRSIVESVRGADAVVVLTPLPELAAVDWAGLAPRRALVVDGCGGLPPDAPVRAGWTHRGP